MPSCSGARQPLLLYKEALLLGKLTWPRCCCCMESTQEPPNSSTPGPFDGPQWPHQAPRAMYLAVAVLMGLVVASASVLNGLVIVVSIRHKRLRSPLNYILVNLAVANLLVTLCGSSVSLSNNISGFFVFGERLCQLEGFMVSLTGKGMGSTALVLLGLALEMFHHRKFRAVEFVSFGSLSVQRRVGDMVGSARSPHVQSWPCQSGKCHLGTWRILVWDAFHGCWLLCQHTWGWLCTRDRKLHKTSPWGHSVVGTTATHCQVHF